MSIFDESAFRFKFGPSWGHVEQWDGCDAYKLGVGNVQGKLDGRDEGTKAVDFVGVRSGEIWFFEIKDFRNRQFAFRNRTRELPLEVALKVRDTLAGLLGRHHAEGAEPWIASAIKALGARASAPTVVAMIAQPQPTRALPETKLKVHRDVLAKQTRQRLAWLTRRVYVVAPAAGEPVPDLDVTPLAQAR